MARFALTIVKMRRRKEGREKEVSKLNINVLFFTSPLCINVLGLKLNTSFQFVKDYISSIIHINLKRHNQNIIVDNNTNDKTTRWCDISLSHPLSNLCKILSKRQATEHESERLMYF